MDIIAIESKTFDQMKERFKDFSRQVKDLCGNNQDKEQWLEMTMFADSCKYRREHYNHTGITVSCHSRRLGANVITGCQMWNS